MGTNQCDGGVVARYRRVWHRNRANHGIAGSQWQHVHRINVGITIGIRQHIVGFGVWLGTSIHPSTGGSGINGPGSIWAASRQAV
jgi:hypothetical protein